MLCNLFISSLPLSVLFNFTTYEENAVQVICGSPMGNTRQLPRSTFPSSPPTKIGTRPEGTVFRICVVKKK